MLERSTLAIQKLFLLIFLLAVSTDAGRPLKILGLFPHTGLSHFNVFHPILRGLAEVGHEVSVISHFPDKSPPIRYRDFVLPHIESENVAESFVHKIDIQMIEKRPFWTQLSEFFFIHELGKSACNRTLRSEALAEVLREKKRYDVIMVEAFNSDCMLGIAYVLNAPIIGISSSALMPWSYERFGVPITPSYMPIIFSSYSHDMSFFERVNNWVHFHFINFLYSQLTVSSADAMIRHKFGHDIPSVGEIAKEMSLILVNTHYSVSGVKPLPPSVIEVGGVHIQKTKAIPVELQRWLDNAEHGVVLVSWGSLIRANSISFEKRDGLLKAFKRLKLRILWKWENDTLANKPDNVLISNWLPQRDVLCHPNVKVFMNHGGLLGTSEAVHCGKPMVVTPIFGDQFLNAAAVESRGMGVILRYNDISENSVIKAVKKALEKSYSDNAKAIAHTYNHRPMTPLQTAIWWVEHVARTEGAPLMKSSAVYMPRFIYYSLDVYLFLGIVASSFISFWVWVIRSLCSRQLGKQKQKQKEKSKSN